MDRFRQITLRAALISGLACMWIYAATKAPQTVERVTQSMLMFDLATRQLVPAGITASGDYADLLLIRTDTARELADAAAGYSTLATNLSALTAAELAAAEVTTLTCSWPYQTREPNAVNQMAHEHWATPTNIAGTLYEDHYIEFSSAPTEAPGMVFEYTDLLGETYNSEAITNSYPTAYPVSLPSGVHSCYRFRCAVPAAFTARLRTWTGPVRFGGPVGSSYGLSIAGVFLIDVGSTIWQGRTLTTEIGSNTVEWINGVAVTPLSAMALAEESEERGILHTLGMPYRAVRSMFQSAEINLKSNTINKTTWQGTETYPLAFPIKE